MTMLNSAKPAALLSLVVLMAGCGGPFYIIPGRELSGSLETKHIDDWSFVEAPFVDLEINGDSLRSVQLNYILREGSLFIDPSEGKTWFTELKKNTNVRIRFDGKIYPVTATLVGKPVELAGFDPERYIYRLESRGGETDSGETQ